MTPTIQEVHDELERVKQKIGATLAVDMRSPAQVAQADKDEADAAKQLAKEAAKAEA